MATQACGESGRGARRRETPKPAHPPTSAQAPARSAIDRGPDASSRPKAPGTTRYPTTRRTPTAVDAATTIAPSAALNAMSIQVTGIPLTCAASRSKATATCARQVRESRAAATTRTRALTDIREGVISRRRPNMRDSSCPDMSPMRREMTMPREKKAVSRTAVVASEWRCLREATVSAAAMRAAHTAPPGMIASRPPRAMPTTMPGKTPWTIVSALNSARRRFTSVEAGPTAIASRPRTMIGRSR